MSLTEQQLRFCREYAARPNATRAYQRAFGPVAYGTARTNGNRLLTNADISAEVDAARKVYARHARVDAAWVLRELAAIAHADPDDMFEPDPDDVRVPRLRPWHEIPPEARRALRSVRVRRRRSRDGQCEVEEVAVTFGNKPAALEKLCRHLGLTGNGAALTELLELLEKGE